MHGKISSFSNIGKERRGNKKWKGGGRIIISIKITGMKEEPDSIE